MKDVYEVLRQKELEQSRLEIEVEALRIVAPLLSDDNDVGNDNDKELTSHRSTAASETTLVPRAGNANPQPAHSAEWVHKAQSRW